MKDRFHALDLLSTGPFPTLPPMPQKRLRLLRSPKARWLSMLNKVRPHRTPAKQTLTIPR